MFFCDSYVSECSVKSCFVFPVLSSLDEDTDSMSQDRADTLPEEDRLEDTSERDALLGSSGTPEVEDSFL